MAYDLYVITDPAIARGMPHGGIARRVVEGGADAVQLRDKTLPGRDLLAVACEIREITEESGVLFFVNDRIDIALAAGADGVHLGQGDLPVREARSISPEGFIIGVSVGSVSEAVAAESAGADYLSLSPIFPTTSKKDAGPGHGLVVLQAICASVTLPVIAIGGITPRNVPEVIAAGAEGVAVISAVIAQEDITAAARHMKAIIRDSKERVRRVR